MSLKRIQNSIGKKLKVLRINADLTQEDVYLATGISRDHISNLENGKYPIKLQTLYTLACYYKVELKYFFE